MKSLMQNETAASRGIPHKISAHNATWFVYHLCFLLLYLVTLPSLVTQRPLVTAPSLVTAPPLVTAPSLVTLPPLNPPSLLFIFFGYACDSANNLLLNLNLRGFYSSCVADFDNFSPFIYFIIFLYSISPDLFSVIFFGEYSLFLVFFSPTPNLPYSLLHK